MDVDVGANEEVTVEHMVPGLDSEEMTPVPDREEEEEVHEPGEEDLEGVEADEEDEITVEEAEKGADEEGDDDEQYAPGTLGKLRHLCDKRDLELMISVGQTYERLRLTVICD